MSQNTSITEASDPEANTDKGGRPSHRQTGLVALALGSIGVVYGDIGTSPLYALREAVKAALPASGGTITADIVYGILSLIIWALFLVVTLKYVVVLLYADNRGEGGTLSLMALAQRGRGKFLASIPLLGMIGAALFYGDGIITPAISVLSAVEGLNVVTPAFEPYVMWITLAVIVALFAVQSSGTARIAALFGPVTLVWFLALAASGFINIRHNPDVLWAFDPLHAISFVRNHQAVAFVTLGAVFLAVTGAEALYADLGHFGRRPIQLAWLVVVLPCLVINYLGQGSLLLHRPEALENPFFLMMPQWALLPMVVLATAATIIASQAVITGAYSLSRQAVQLGLLPRMPIAFTSETQAGQIYMPQINWLLFFGVVLLVVSFKTSGNLASAYGIAVTGTMVVTSILAMFVIKNRWKWSYPATLGLMLPLLAVDSLFLYSSALKIHEGGWVPLALGAAMILVMWTWRKGMALIRERTRKMETPIASLVRSLGNSSAHRIPGTAIFFTPDTTSAPTALLHSLKHYKVLHKSNVILTIKAADTPYVDDDKRISNTVLSDAFTSVTIQFGYMELPDVPRALKQASIPGISFDPMTTSYFLSRRNLQPSAEGGMPVWQDRLFILMARNADDASNYFQLPAEQVVEVGSRITI